MSYQRQYLIALGVLLFSRTAGAEIPLPPATFYGRIDGAGALIATVTRDGQRVLTARADFREHLGNLYFVIEIPLETAIGVAGPSGIAAREGDILDLLELDGTTFSRPRIRLEQALVQELAGIEPESGFVRGDANVDGKMNLTDAVFTLLWLFQGGASAPCQDAADVNDSGGVDITDAVNTLSYLYRGAAPPSPPFGSCGQDPSPDRLGCNRYQPCEGAAGGGGGGLDGLAAGEVEKYQVAPPAQDAIQAVANPPLAAVAQAPEQIGNPVPRHLIAGVGLDEAAAAAWVAGPLEVSPHSISWGSPDRVGQERSFTLVNHDSGVLHLNLRSLTGAFEVYPRQVSIPANGSFAAFITLVEPELLARTPSAESAVAVQATAHGAELVRIPLEVDVVEAAFGVLDVGSIARPAGSIESFHLPVHLEANTGLAEINFALGYDRGLFANVTFLPNLEVVEAVRLENGEGAQQMALQLHRAAHGRVEMGKLFVEPLQPLSASTSQILLTKVRGDDGGGHHVELRSTHGEVLALKQWLDLDEDGSVRSDLDLILARRHFTGLDPWPEVWGAGRPDIAELDRKLEQRSTLFDVNASGSVDAGDFEEILAWLSASRAFSTDTSARIRNLAVWPDRTVLQHGLHGVLGLLRYLFHGEPLPPAPPGIDLGPDGIPSLDDAVRGLEQAFPR